MTVPTGPSSPRRNAGGRVRAMPACALRAVLLAVPRPWLALMSRLSAAQPWPRVPPCASTVIRPGCSPVSPSSAPTTGETPAARERRMWRTAP